MKRLVLLFALASITPLVQADEIFAALLLPGNEVPPHSGNDFGSIVVDLHPDQITLDVTEVFAFLTTPATAAHIHCCVPPGTNAGVVLPFVGFPNVTTGSYTHTFNLSTDLVGITQADFLAGLRSGNAYANIHDAAFPGGDIRGQLQGVPEPGIFSMLGGCLAALALWRRRLA